MKQAIAGVAPSQLGEVTNMTVWPTISCIPAGRMVGRFCAKSREYGVVATFIACALSIPIALPLFFGGLLPGLARRYTLTNRRIIERVGLSGKESKSVSLADFNSIDIEVLPGQEWFPAGELIFRNDNVETFRLSGVSRPEAFRQVCLKAQRSYQGVQTVLKAQAAMA